MICPYLWWTVRNKTEDILAAFEAGANDFLCKPFDRKEFLARTKTMLELKRAVDKAVTSELHFLQAQIKPHFLYNVMNSVIALSRTDPEKAREMLLELSNYLRKSFDFKNTENYVRADRELSLVKSYLSIEKVRFADRLSILYDVDENVDVMIPPLILQPHR